MPFIYFDELRAALGLLLPEVLRLVCVRQLEGERVVVHVLGQVLLLRHARLHVVHDHVRHLEKQLV